MEFSTASGGSGDGSGPVVDNEACDSSGNRKRVYHRHSTGQVQRLEEFFRECPHPDDHQRRQLARELNLEPRQIKFWFQNKRTQTKSQTDRAYNSTLRVENERITNENIAIKEALKTALCPSCGGPEERKCSLDKLQQENTRLRHELGRVSSILLKTVGKPLYDSLLKTFDRSLAGVGTGSPSLLAGLSGNNLSDNPELGNQRGTPKTEPLLVAKIASNSLDELIKLLQIDEPLWFKSQTDGRLSLHQKRYEEAFPLAIYFKFSGTRMESSKHSGIVAMSGKQLVDILLDSVSAESKWADMFPTYISKAGVIQVLEAGILGNRSGSLQLANERMHFLSPLISPREFSVLRYCKQTDTGVWVLMETSYDCVNGREAIPGSCSWKHPSGCMIEDLSNGLSKVTWVERVEIEDEEMDPLFRNLVTSGLAFGAERWITTLQRMTERNAYFIKTTTPGHELDGAIKQAGRKNMVMLACRMIKSFCCMLVTLDMTDFLGMPYTTTDFHPVRLALRKNADPGPGQPSGIIVSATCSVWLPTPPHVVFAYFMDHKLRPQWDVLSNGTPVREIVLMTTGANQGNHVSVLQPFNAREKVLIFQESFVDCLGSLIVYAPVNVPSLDAAARGFDSSHIPILPSGFIISSNGRTPRGNNTASTDTNEASTSNSASGPRSGGSLLTFSFNLLASTDLSAASESLQSVLLAKAIVGTTIQQLRAKQRPSTELKCKQAHHSNWALVFVCCYRPHGYRPHDHEEEETKMWYLCVFYHRLLDYRKPEVEALAHLFGVFSDDEELHCWSSPEFGSLRWKLPEHHHPDSPFHFVDLPSEDIARNIANRSILVKGMYEVWGEGSSYDDLEEAIGGYPEERKSPYLTADSTFKINIDSFGKAISSEDQKDRIQRLAFIPFKGRVDLRNPEHKFWLMETDNYGSNNGLPPVVQKRIFFGREVGAADRKLLPTYQLKSRNYLGPTAMDAEMAFLMANQGLAAPGKLIYDPFVGTGSILVAAAHFGAMTMGADIDIRVVRDGRGPNCNVWSNFRQYGLPEPISLLRADNNLPPWRAGLKEVFDGVICDPPYGVRAGGRKSGGRKLLKGVVDPYTVPEDKRADHIPSTAAYSLVECVHDLLDLAAKMLVMGGRLVFFYPILRDKENNESHSAAEADFPEHPCFRLAATCEQILSFRYSRVLLTMVKIAPYTEAIAESAKKMHLDFRENHLKWIEEGNLHSAVFAPGPGPAHLLSDSSGYSKIWKEESTPKYRGKYV
ncbi:hypothetical protein Dimus_012383 [Dionaea muscipula]